MLEDEFELTVQPGEFALVGMVVLRNTRYRRISARGNEQKN